MAKQETNVQFVARIMEFCPTGALAHAFVLEALAQYADKCAAADPREMNCGMLVSGEAWNRTAKYIQRELNAKYRPEGR
jgi:hypothetical protein